MVARMWWAEEAIDADGIAEIRQNQLRLFGETWTQTCAQAPLLVGLALHHGELIGRSQAEMVQTALTSLQELVPLLLAPKLADQWSEYAKDFTQRTLLFVETLCERGDASLARDKEGFKPVLAFDYDVIVDGRKLDRPVNYALVRIHPPQGTMPPHEDSRPWVIIDPRAGHGSGIGGFKSESEVGVALKYGHPVYFVIFFPDPEPGQTLADVTAAEAVFLQEVQARHPRGPKPLVTGNCQGGWASMILAATHPDLMGPVVIAGAPLSYWAGARGRNPLRYFGGIAGGALPALIASDLGGGRFDGANLVLNFEQLNPGKTWFRKNFDLFANVDHEAPRFLDFERWWSGFYFMNGSEIRWIVENLFVGNRLTRGEAFLDDGTPIDLTRIEAPVVVFASHGDNITPPQQALSWIADLYPSVAELAAHGHVVIYTLHDSIGHLGIFVSAQVARTQHAQIGAVVKTIESLAPGLYEMLIEKNGDVYEVSFEARTIDDILKLDDDREDEVEFAAVSGLSEWATKTYELTVQPFVAALVTPTSARARKELHPLRLQHQFFSHKNPLFTNLGEMAAAARARRTPAEKDNVFVRLETFHADLTEQLRSLSRRARRRDRDRLPRALRNAVDETSRRGAAGAPAVARHQQIPPRPTGDPESQVGRLRRGRHPHADPARPCARRGAARPAGALRQAVAFAAPVQLDDPRGPQPYDLRAIADRAVRRQRGRHHACRPPQGPGRSLSLAQSRARCRRAGGGHGRADHGDVHALPARAAHARPGMARPRSRAAPHDRR